MPPSFAKSSLPRLFSLFTLLFSLCLPLVSRAQPPAQNFDPARAFAEASRAYDENRLADAVATFSDLADRGYASPDVLFNLGNAAFRDGRLPLAVASYLRARRLAPRDPDIRANLAFAAQTAGIDLPTRAPLARLLLSLSRREAALLFHLSAWLLFLLLALAVWLPTLRAPLRFPVLLLLLPLLFAVASLTCRHLDARRPEAVLLAPANLLAAPLDSSTPLLSLPEASVVRVLATHGPWTQVLPPSAPTPAWLPTTTLSPL